MKKITASLSILLAVLDFTLPDDLAVWMALLVIPINASFCPIMFGLVPMIRDAWERRVQAKAAIARK